MIVQLNLDKDVFCPKLFPLLFNYDHRYEFYLGSAASGKSYFIVQKLIVRACQEKIRILVCRRYASTLRNSVFALFKEILAKWNLTGYVKIRETDFTITFPSGSEIIFVGLDSEEKLLSLANISCIFIEEIMEVPKDMFEQLNLRMRGKAKNQQIIAAFNPSSKKSWLYDFCEVNPPESFILTKTTFHDNPFLSKEYIASLNDLLVRNPRKARVYVEGLWALDDEGLVFSNWEEQEFDPYEIGSRPGIEHRCGLDVGFSDPTAIIDTFYDRENYTIYVFNEFYKKAQTLDQIYNGIVDMGLRKSKIYCDSADARLIDYLRRKGCDAQPSLKGQGSVNAGIAFLQNNRIVVLPKCQNLIIELENFAYIKDNKTNQYTEKTTHQYSHAIDGLRYAYSNIYTNNKLRTIDKKVLGIR